MRFQKSATASNVLAALRKRKEQSKANGADSLDILRENLQYFFNDKVNSLMKEFMQTFFEPAIKNIKENTNESITDQQVSELIIMFSEVFPNEKFFIFTTSRKMSFCDCWKSFPRVSFSSRAEFSLQKAFHTFSLSFTDQESLPEPFGKLCEVAILLKFKRFDVVTFKLIIHE